MLDEFGRTGILLGFAVLFPSLPLLVSVALRKLRLRPDAPDPIKLDTYECGVETEGDSWVQFNFRYYLIALLFVVFDVEVVFLLPWAVVFRELGLLAFVEGVVFILILAVGLAYVWRKGDLEWVRAEDRA